MQMASKTKIRSKLLVDNKCEKVLFAEAGKDFVDFLFGLLQIPLGSILGILVEQNMAWPAGSLSRVYESIQNLDPTYLQPNQQKDSLLKPKQVCSSSYNPTSPLFQNLAYKKPQESSLFGCSSSFSSSPSCSFSSSSFFSSTSSCSFSSSSPLSFSGFAPPPPSPPQVGYVKGVVTYMVMDDLMVKPMSTISSITLLNTFNVKDVGDLQEMTIELGTEKALELLKVSFESNTVLTDVFLGKKGTLPTRRAKPEI